LIDKKFLHTDPLIKSIFFSLISRLEKMDADMVSGDEFLVDSERNEG